MGATNNNNDWKDEVFTHIIGGRQYPQDGPWMNVTNPATEETVARVPIATPAVVDEAVRAAREAQPAWAALSWQQRADKLREWHKGAYTAARERLIPLFVAEQGRTTSMANIEWDFVEEFWNIDAYYEPKDEVIEDDGVNKHILRKYPMGVTAALVPWNYPLVLSIIKVLPALLTGNTVIVKPSPFTPLMTLGYILTAQSYLPPGVLNAVVGDDALGKMLTEHPNVDHVSFTGSTNTGRLVARSCSLTLKRMTLELGGNDACIVFEGVDIPQVALQVFISALQNAGQFCSAAKRIYIQDSIYDEFAAVFTGICNATKVGNGALADTEFEKVNEFLHDIQEKGYKTFTGGKVHSGKGFFVPITVVDNPPDDSKIVREEPFGPVLPLLRFSSEDEVVRRANDSDMGLGGHIWGPIDIATRVADRLETGTVWVNQLQSFNPKTYFSGWKLSGIGGALGRQGIEAYMRSKTLRLVSLPINASGYSQLTHLPYLFPLH